jgi:hypothetical protein
MRLMLKRKEAAPLVKATRRMLIMRNETSRTSHRRAARQSPKIENAFRPIKSGLG